MKTYYLIPRLHKWDSFEQYGERVEIQNVDGSCGFCLIFSNKKKAEKLAKELGFNKEDIIYINYKKA